MDNTNTNSNSTTAMDEHAHYHGEADDLTFEVVSRHDTSARVARYDAVSRAGCEHSAVRWNGQVELVTCPRCADR